MENLSLTRPTPSTIDPPDTERSVLRLRPYQVEALTAIETAARRGVQRQLLTLPTGLGKTVIFAALIARRGGRALILVHRDELVTQAVAKIQMAMPNAVVGIIKAQRNDVTATIVVASVQTLSRPARLEQLTPDFTTIVIDEAHHATAPTYRRILVALGVLPADPVEDDHA